MPTQPGSSNPAATQHSEMGPAPWLGGSFGAESAVGSSGHSLSLRQCSCVPVLWEAKCPFAARDVVVIVHEPAWISDTDAYKS